MGTAERRLRRGKGPRQEEETRAGATGEGQSLVSERVGGCRGAEISDDVQVSGSSAEKDDDFLH